MGFLHPTGRHRADVVAKAGMPNVIAVDAFGVNRPNLDGILYPDAAYQTYARSGFGRNELVYACIQEKCRTLPQAALRVYGEGQAEPLEDHRLRRLLVEPNDVTNEVEFLQLLVLYLDLSGSAFSLINRAVDGRPAELWPIRPDRVRVIPAPRGANPRAWKWGYAPGEDLPENPTAIFPVERRDMIRVRYPNPLDPYFGHPPMRAAARAVSVDNARSDYVDELLRNDAVPRVVVKTQTTIDEKVVGFLEARWSRKFGPGNRGKPAFLQAGMDVEVLGLNLEELEFGDLSSINEARVCMSFGVQPILIGAKVGLDRSTFANFAEAKASFWETTLMDLQHLTVAAFRSQLLGDFNGARQPRIDMRWDNSEVLALQEAEKDRWERAIGALARGGITRNMFLQAVGFDPVPGGDVFLTPAGVVPTQLGETGIVDPAAAPAARPPAEDEEAPQVEAASYAEALLAGRGSTWNGRNGHRPGDPSGVVAE